MTTLSRAEALVKELREYNIFAQDDIIDRAADLIEELLREQLPISDIPEGWMFQDMVAGHNVWGTQDRYRCHLYKRQHPDNVMGEGPTIISALRAAIETVKS